MNDQSGLRKLQCNIMMPNDGKRPTIQGGHRQSASAAGHLQTRCSVLEWLHAVSVSALHISHYLQLKRLHLHEVHAYHINAVEKARVVPGSKIMIRSPLEQEHASIIFSTSNSHAEQSTYRSPKGAMHHPRVVAWGKAQNPVHTATISFDHYIFK